MEQNYFVVQKKWKGKNHIKVPLCLGEPLPWFSLDVRGLQWMRSNIGAPACSENLPRYSTWPRVQFRVRLLGHLMNRQGTVQSRIVLLPSCKGSMGAWEVIWSEQAKEFQACGMEPDVCFCWLCFTHALGVLYLHRQIHTQILLLAHIQKLAKGQLDVITQLNYMKRNLIGKTRPPQAWLYVQSWSALIPATRMMFLCKREVLLTPI